MRKMLLILILGSCTSCAYKPRLLINADDHELSIKECFVLGKNIQNKQQIYYVIDNGLRDFHGKKELSFYYELDNFLQINKLFCTNKISYEITAIESNDLYYSDTGLIAHGFKIRATVNFIKDGQSIKQQIFEMQDRVPLYSAFTSTKKRINKKMVLIMNKVFADLTRKVSAVGSNLQSR